MSNKEELKQLKRCPFCGNNGEIKTKYYRGHSSLNRPQETEGIPLKKIIWVGCFNPRCWQPRTYSSLKEKSIQQWNERN